VVTGHTEDLAAVDRLRHKRWSRVRADKIRRREALMGGYRLMEITEPSGKIHG
jgi:hypothetical protein